MTTEELRKIDVEIATKVMGWRSLVTSAGVLDWNDGERYRVLPHYSTKIECAWEVVEKLCRWKFTLTWNWDFGGGKKDPKPFATAIFDPVLVDQRESLFVEADTAPLAICLAALKAIGIPV